MYRVLPEAMFERTVLLGDPACFKCMCPDEIEDLDNRNEFCFLVRESWYSEYCEIDTGYETKVMSSSKFTCHYNVNSFLEYVFSNSCSVTNALLYNPNIGTKNYINQTAWSRDRYQTDDPQEEAYYLYYEGHISHDLAKSISNSIDGMVCDDRYIKVPTGKYDILKLCIPESKLYDITNSFYSFDVMWYPDDFIILSTDITSDFRYHMNI